MNRKTQILRATLTGAALTVMTLLTTGCGMKGPLYLPTPATAASQPSTPPSK